MNKSVNYVVPLAIVGLMFVLIGFSLGINGILIPFLKRAFDLTNAQSYLVLTATFSSFVVFGYPSGVILKRLGYRKTIVLSFVLFSAGLYLFIPSGATASFFLFLVASFVSGMGNTLLQAAINPYITILGPKKYATTRMCMMIICNRIGWAIAPVFLSVFINISGLSVSLSDLFVPFYIIVGVFLLLGLFAWFAPLPEITVAGEDETDESHDSLEVKRFVDTKKSVFGFPHLILGAWALFFYVGVDTLCMVSMVDFAQSLGLDNPERYMSYSVAGISVGCVLGVMLVPGIVSQLNGLRIGAVAALLLSFLIPLVNPRVGIFLIPAISFLTCLTWGAVWSLAISYLGKYTKVGSSLLVVAMVGGAVLPLLFGLLKDTFGDIQHAYWLFVPCMLFITYYSFLGYKAGLKNAGFEIVD